MQAMLFRRKQKLEQFIYFAPIPVSAHKWLLLAANLEASEGGNLKIGGGTNHPKPPK
jgi:hypothetical protein